MSSTIRKAFPVQGLGCASCVLKVENRLKELKGVVYCSVNLAANTAVIEFDPSAVQPEDFRKALKEIGYDLSIPAGNYDSPDDDPEELAEEEAEKLKAKEYRRVRIDMYLAIALALLILLLRLGIKIFPGKIPAVILLASISVFWCGRRFHINALKQIMHFRVSMDSLVSLSTLVSYAFSFFALIFPGIWSGKGESVPFYFDTAAMIIAFILVGKVLEEKAKYGTTASIRKLQGLRPRKSKVNPGDKVTIKAGERITFDGKVVGGYSFVDESSLTGEPVPAEKYEGKPLYAGSLNQDGILQAVVEKTGADTMLAGIIRMVKDAQGSKPAIQRTVDKIASIFIPIVVVIAAVTFFYWFLFAPAGTGGLGRALLNMVSVLVIACPCALGLATPCAIVAGIGKGADLGILIKNADALQLAHKIQAVVLDKTGTMTVGNPRMVESRWFDPDTKGVLKGLEQNSLHPLARPILASLEDVPAESVSDYANVPGKGIEGRSGGVLYHAGNTSPAACPEADAWKDEGRTVIYFSGNGKLLAAFAFEDEAKEGALDAVLMLEAMGVESHLVSGDSTAATGLAAKRMGISNFKGEVFPDGKAQYVSELKRRKKVAMVGDGINDTAALATADLGIAMGNGSDIAMDTAMVTIVSSDLAKLPELVNLSRKTANVINTNLIFAFVYNVTAIPMAAGLFGFSLTPAIAAACMALSSICVVWNSLRLKK